jgi:hypothetical protein
MTRALRANESTPRDHEPDVSGLLRDIAVRHRMQRRTSITSSAGHAMTWAASHADSTFATTGSPSHAASA